MNIHAWYRKRGIRFVLERAQKLSRRYSFTPAKAIQRVEHCLQALDGYNCSPTFFVPGMVVERNAPLIQRLQERGCEIAVHGYNHIDLKACPPEEASEQLLRAMDVFFASGLEAAGFRCPYLSATDDLIAAVPPGVFGYSSNQAVQWPHGKAGENGSGLLFETIEGFYVPIPSAEHLCIPWQRNENALVEIPVSVPDDLQLYDGLGYTLEQVSGTWSDILCQTYRRGEMFNLMFHPELASFCEAPFLSVLREARSFQPNVWVARLRDISAWWKEKASFRVQADFEDGHASLKFFCTPRATILYRGFEPQVPAYPWAGDYWRLENGAFRINSPVLPFVGLPPGAPRWVEAALRGMGYLLDTTETASRCGVYLDDPCLARFDNPVDLIGYIESTPGPLIRFWPWPDGMRSALCITGDLDALSFFDYASRLLVK